MQNAPPLIFIPFKRETRCLISLFAVSDRLARKKLTYSIFSCPFQKTTDGIRSLAPLGAGPEVRRSCHVLEFRGMTVMLDIGIHPGYDEISGLPYLDRIEPDENGRPHAASLIRSSARVEFLDQFYKDAKVSVDCRDKKLANSIHECLRNATEEANQCRY
jgi:hypothetical protein